MREIENDVSFLRLYLTEELVNDLDLFVFRAEEGEWRVTDKAGSGCETHCASR